MTAIWVWDGDFKHPVHIAFTSNVKAFQKGGWATNLLCDLTPISTDGHNSNRKPVLKIYILGSATGPMCVECLIGLMS